MLKVDFEKIKNSENFKEIINNSFLISCFLNENLESLWEYNFYSKSQNNVSSFIVKNNQVILKDTCELVSKKLPKELFLNNLKLEKLNVSSIVDEFISKNYNNDLISKKMVTIENEDFIIWNIILILKN